MRPILPDDLDRCARALMPLDPAARGPMMMRLLGQADLADRFRKHIGALHPRYGDGSLGVAAWRAGLATRPPRCDAAYCECLSIVLESLQIWRSRTRRPGIDHAS